MDLHSPHYSIRQFTIEDVDAYKAIRLEALQLEPGMFGNSYAKEADFADNVWSDRLSSPHTACFGLYCNEDLAGITGIFSEPDKPYEAYMTQSYIRKAHRGKGLSRMLYEARLEWAKAHHVKRLIIGHRASNLVSKAANQRFGFQFTHQETRTWPDGATEDMLYYSLEL